MGKFDEFKMRREQGNKKILSEDYLPIKRFFALDSRAYEDGKIPPRYKELMGLVGSAVLRCDDCIAYHIEQCHKQGCSRPEIIEALNIALVIGGSIVIPHLREAFEIMDEIEERN